MNRFLLICIGQNVSLLGSSVTGFALAIWIYQQTDSVTWLACVSLCNVLPGVVCAPLAGALVDRWNRRSTMILSDLGSGLCTLSIAISFLISTPNLYCLCVFTAIGSAFGALQWPAFLSSVSILVPKSHLTRANGMSHTGEAIAELGAPILGGILLTKINIFAVFAFDFLTFAFAVATLLFVRIPSVRANDVGSTPGKPRLPNVLFGWRFVTRRPGLLGLVLFFAMINFFTGCIQVLVTPLVLSFASVAVLGTVMTIGGLGMLTGGLVMMTWRGPQRLVTGIFLFSLVEGLFIAVAGLQPSVILLGVCAFCFFFGLPISEGCSDALFQRKVPLHVQGRVFAIERMITGAALPLGYLAAGPLADSLFEPLMAHNGLLSNSLGRVLGTGEGRGIGLMFVCVGTCIVLVTAIACSFRKIRSVEYDLPDANSKSNDEDPFPNCKTSKRKQIPIFNQTPSPVNV